MPILFRYLLGNYIRVLLLCVTSFITILLVTRLDEIAHFAALGGQSRTLTLFTIYQIPYILPIAIPISALLSAMILSQKLSHSHELSAMRASGISLKMIITPLLIAGGMLSLLNFYIASELTTQSKSLSRQMIQELTSINPIILLQNAKVAKLKGAYIQMETVRNGELAKEIIIAVNSGPAKRLNLFVTKEMEVKEQLLKSKEVSFISSIANSQLNEFDHLIVENQKISETSAPQFANILRKNSSKFPSDYLKWSHLALKAADLKLKLAAREKESSEKESEVIDRHLKRQLNRIYTDGLRRISMGLAALTFTFMGICFGMEIGRRSTKKGIFSVTLLGAASLVSFFIAKEMDDKLILSATLYFFPHILILGGSIRTLKRINRGIE